MFISNKNSALNYYSFESLLHTDIRMGGGQNLNSNNIVVRNFYLNKLFFELAYYD